MLLVYGTSTKMMECHKCRDVVVGRGRGAGGKAQPRRLMAMRNSSLVNWSCSNVQHNGADNCRLYACVYLMLKKNYLYLYCINVINFEKKKRLVHNMYEYFDLAIFRARPHMILAVGGTLNPKSTKICFQKTRLLNY